MRLVISLSFSLVSLPDNITQLETKLTGRLMFRPKKKVMQFKDTIPLRCPMIQTYWASLGALESEGKLTL